MDFTADYVEQTVCQFYSDSNRKPLLNVWLTAAQHSTNAWHFAWKLLDKNKKEEVQFFGGNTIYIKVSRFWHEVPPENREQLKIDLFKALVQFSKSKLILSRLSKAMAAFILHTITDHWQTAINDLISTFNPDTISVVDTNTALELLFNVLTVLPSEVENCKKLLDRSTSYSSQPIVHALVANSKLVMDAASDVMKAPQVSNVTKELVIHTITAWLSLSLPLNSTNDVLLALIPYSKYGLLCESVVECLRTALTDSSTHSYPITILDFLGKILNLKPVLQEAVISEDENTSSLIYSLFTSIIETHSRLLLSACLNESQRGPVLDIISMLVDCSATRGQYPTDETISCIPFPIWFTIQDEISALEVDQDTELTLMFKPVYLKLIDNFILKSILPTEGVMNSEEQELFRCYRQDICDAYMYAYSILQAEMLDKFEAHLREGVARLQRNTGDWRYLEAVLHAYSSVAETIQEADQCYIARFVEGIPHIPYGDNLSLISVALTTLGAYADWLNVYRDHLDNVIPMMVAALNNDALISSASQALRDITLECHYTLTPYAPQVLEGCQKALQKVKKIDGAEVERLVTIISRVLSVSTDQEFVIKYLENTIGPYLGRIAILKDLPETFVDPARKHELSCLLKMVCCLARHLNTSAITDFQEEEIKSGGQHSVKATGERFQPVLLVLQQLLPILSDIGKKAAKDSNIVDILCQVIKNSVSTLKDVIAPIISPILEMIVTLYQESHNASVLEIVKQLFLLLGRDPNHKAAVELLSQRIVDSSLAHLTPTPWQYTDTLRAFLDLISYTIKKVAHVMPGAHVFNIFALAMTAIKLPEEGTVRSASHFFGHCILHSKEKNNLEYQQIVRHYLDPLIRIVIYTSCNCVRHNINSLSDVIYSLSRCYYQELVDVMYVIKAEEKFLPETITKEVLADFITKVLRYKGNRKKILEAVADLALVSKGIAGTEYAAQTRPLML